VTPFIRKILFLAGFVAIAGLATVFGIFFLSTNTVGMGQKCAGKSCWGYELDQYTFSKRTVLSINGAAGLHLQFELPKMQIERANDDRWLATDRAVYLNLRARPLNDSAAAPVPIRLLYDFQRGELYVSSPLPLWRVNESQAGSVPKVWMTETEFQRTLASIEP
jgi:hypothetical protein